MYSIGHVIYGIPLTEKLTKIAEQRDEELDEEEGGYFITLYHGGGDDVGYLGIELTSFDECENFRLYDIVKNVTVKHMEDFHDMFHKLPEEYKQAAPEPSVWVVWSTS